MQTTSQGHKKARFQQLGFSLKAVLACLVILLVWVSLPLGVLAFGGFIYVHILLRPHNRLLATSPSIIAPIDGRIAHIEARPDGTAITLIGDLLASQVITAPASGLLADKLWIDGAFMQWDGDVSIAANARHELQIQTTQGHMITMSVYGTQLTRLTHIAFAEGQHMLAGEPIGYALPRALIILHVPAGIKVTAQVGHDCLAGQSPLTHAI